MMDTLTGAMDSGLAAVLDYLVQHTINCLVPAFFIAGAIAALVRKDAILRFFGADVEKYKSYSMASVSGTVLAVCSCTILPLFAGIFKKGSGLGPATTFLFAGPAINLLAVIYTAQVLGLELGAARAFFAVLMSILVGLTMAFIFKADDNASRERMAAMPSSPEENPKPRWVLPAFFAALVGILVFGASGIDLMVKLTVVFALIIVVILLLIRYFTTEETVDWGLETWDLTKKIFPILLIGTFLVGVFAYFVPPETFRPYLGGNDIGSVLLASLMGALLYMPTLLEVPIVGGTLGYSTGVMASGPALALLLAGPTTSLPALVVLYRVMGLKRTMVYWILVILMATIAGVVFGYIVG